MSVSVLMYHHVLRNGGFIASSVDEFRAQMSFLARDGYRTLSAAEFIAYKNGELKVPKKSVFITFDDGWKDNFIYAYPILHEFGLRATIFLVTQWIERASEKRGEFIELTHSEYKKAAPLRPQDVFLSLDEIAKMRDVFDFHSHTHTHFDEYFGALEPSEDFAKCREFMRVNFGFDDELLCWPRGKFDENLLQIAREAGYKAFFTTQRGINRPDGKLDAIKRIAAKKDAAWLRRTLFIYQNDLWGGIYARIKG
ncbi:polysaccharide deacetylase family protein [Campylobacter curvus]|uniref:polysaccharide deacetylase family protein n=1 Tax=Campylobacter curvus TaxID=200 RepID=UPI00146FEEFD|nr:polysaccharide deacetylase family protein [Campylobacter curvus]